jgi:hypothetical protein
LCFPSLLPRSWATTTGAAPVRHFARVPCRRTQPQPPPTTRTRACPYHPQRFFLKSSDQSTKPTASSPFLWQAPRFPADFPTDSSPRTPSVGPNFASLQRQQPPPHGATPRHGHVLHYEQRLLLPDPRACVHTGYHHALAPLAQTHILERTLLMTISRKIRRLLLGAPKRGSVHCIGAVLLDCAYFL